MDLDKCGSLSNTFLRAAVSRSDACSSYALSVCQQRAPGAHLNPCSNWSGGLQCSLRYPATSNAAQYWLCAAAHETWPGLRAIHEQKSLRVPDGNGFWPRSGFGLSRRRQARTDNDLCCVVVAHLDRACPIELSRWHSRHVG